jgi:hypothetical protein
MVNVKLAQMLFLRMFKMFLRLFGLVLVNVYKEKPRRNYFCRTFNVTLCEIQNYDNIQKNINQMKVDSSIY